MPTLAELPPPPKGKRGWPWTESPAPQTVDTGRLPSISIVTPSYQQAEYIEETLRSVLLQGYPKLEYFVIDGGSRDGAVAIIEKYARWLSAWVSEKDRGQSDAINKGLAQCGGQLVGWLNSDDVFAPGALLTFGLAFRDDTPNDLLIGHGVITDLAGRTVYAPRHDIELTAASLGDWIHSTHFMQPSCLFPRTVNGQAVRVDESLHYCMDLDLWVRLAKAGCGLRRVDGCLSMSKRHGATKSDSQRRFMHAEIAATLGRHGYTDAVHRELQRWAEEANLLEAAGRRLGPLFRWARSWEKRSRQRLTPKS